jgi:hypothetical protein
VAEAERAVPGYRVSGRPQGGVQCDHPQERCRTGDPRYSRRQCGPGRCRETGRALQHTRGTP